VLTVHDLSPLEHPEWFASRFALWYRLLWSVLIPRVRRILVPSQFVKERLTANFGPRPITVIPEGVDLAFFRPDAPGGTLQLPEKYVLFVGSLSPRKNVTGLLQAWRRISSEFPDIWLVIAGSKGANFSALPHGDEPERVHFCGYVPDADLPALYAGAMLLVLPSLQEGFGLPILEAMACGTPVLASDGGALPETMGNAGMIFALSDPGGLTDAMTILLRNPDLRAELRRAGQEHASKHSWEITAELLWREIHGL
jgi:glycosyltransferase involved in cell wall biosynthesis